MHWPFRGYGDVFMRVSQGISRQQELSADMLSARIAGGRPAASALRKIQRAALTYSGFLDGEYGIALRRGFRHRSSKASSSSASSARGPTTPSRA
jgi:Zn-dependent protease with chaperone function